MAKFKNDKGLTLIELLITIAVLAVVSAIALPVINNVVSSSNSNAAAQTQSDVTDFIAKYNAAGEVLLSTDGRTLQGYVDTDGDNTIDSNELVDTLTIDAKFSFSASGSSDNVGGSYTSKGISGATAGLASASTGTPTTGLTLSSIVASRTFGEVDGASSYNAPNTNGYADRLFTWSVAGVDYYAYSDSFKDPWWVDWGIVSSVPTPNADGTRTWNTTHRGAVTEYKLSTDLSSIVPF